MRVLQLIDSLDAGGAERMAVNISNGLMPYVEASYLCATRKEGLLKSNLNKGVGYIFLNKRTTFDLKAIKGLRHFIKTHKISIIHAHSTSYFLGTVMKLLIPKLKLVWHDHYGNSEFINQRPAKVLKLCSYYFSHVFCVNNSLLQWVQSHLKLKSVSYLANFADAPDTIVKTTLLKGQQGKRILCLANLRPQKDHLTLFKGFKLFQNQFPDWSLHCVGKDFEDNYSKSVYELLEELELKDDVFLYGSCPDSYHIIEQCDIGVLSSQSEGLPLALLEYGLGALAVVVTDVGDCKKVVCNNNLGVLIPPNSPEQLYEALVKYAEDANFRSDKGLRFQSHIQSHYSEATAINTIKAVYEKIKSTE